MNNELVKRSLTFLLTFLGDEVLHCFTGVSPSCTKMGNRDCISWGAFGGEGHPLACYILPLSLIIADSMPVTNVYDVMPCAILDYYSEIDCTPDSTSM